MTPIHPGDGEKRIKEKGWLTNCVDEAHKAHPSVGVASVTSIRELMKGKVLDRQLSAAELKSIVTSLLADIVPKHSPKADITDAD